MSDQYETLDGLLDEVRGGAIVFGGSEGLKDYMNLVYNKNKEKLIRDIAEDVFKTMKLKGAGNAQTAPLKNVIDHLKSVTPDPKKGAGGFNKNTSSSSKSQKSILTTLAESINNRYKSNMINMSAEPNVMANQVSEVIHTLLNGLQVEFLTIATDVSKIVKNLTDLKDLVERSYTKQMEIIRSSGDQSLTQQSNAVGDVYNVVSNEIDRQMALLTNALSVAIGGPSGESIISLIQENKDFSGMIHELKGDLGQTEFSVKLGKLLSGVSSVATTAVLVEKALKVLNMNLKEYESAKDRGDLRVKVFNIINKNKPKTSKELDKMLAAAKLLYKQPNIEEIADYISKHSGKSNSKKHSNGSVHDSKHAKCSDCGKPNAKCSCHWTSSDSDDMSDSSSDVDGGGDEYSGGIELDSNFNELQNLIKEAKDISDNMVIKKNKLSPQNLSFVSNLKSSVQSHLLKTGGNEGDEKKLKEKIDLINKKTDEILNNVNQNNAINKAISRKQVEKNTLSQKVNELQTQIDNLNNNLYTMKDKDTTLNNINSSISKNLIKEYIFTNLNKARANLQLIYNSIVETKTQSFKGGAESDDDENLPRYWAKKSLSKKVKKKERLRKIMFEDFRKILEEKYRQIVGSSSLIAENIGKSIPANSDLDRFIKFFEQIPSMNQENIQYAISGYARDIGSREKKSQFFNSFQVILSAMEPLEKGAKGELFRELGSHIKDLLKTIDDFSDTFLKTLSEVNIEKPEEIKREISKTVMGSAEMSKMSSKRPFVQLDKIKNELQYYYRVAHIKENLQSSAKDLEKYGEGYEDMLGEEAGWMIDHVNDYFDKLSLFYKNFMNDAENKDKLSKLLLVLEKMRKTKIGLIKVAQAVDLYLKGFTDGFVNDPDSIQNILHMLEQVEIVAKWFNNKSGENIKNLFKTFGGTDDIKNYDKDKSVKDDNVDKAMLLCEKSIKSMRALENILSIFHSVGNKFNNVEISNKTFMNEGQIFNALCEYIKMSSFTFNVSDLETTITKNYEKTSEFEKLQKQFETFNNKLIEEYNKKLEAAKTEEMKFLLTEEKKVLTSTISLLFNKATKNLKETAGYITSPISNIIKTASNMYKNEYEKFLEKLEEGEAMEEAMEKKLEAEKEAEERLKKEEGEVVFRQNISIQNSINELNDRFMEAGKKYIDKIKNINQTKNMKIFIDLLEKFVSSKQTYEIDEILKDNIIKMDAKYLLSGKTENDMNYMILYILLVYIVNVQQYIKDNLTENDVLVLESSNNLILKTIVKKNMMFDYEDDDTRETDSLVNIILKDLKYRYTTYSWYNSYNYNLNNVWFDVTRYEKNIKKAEDITFSTGTYDYQITFFIKDVRMINLFTGGGDEKQDQLKQEFINYIDLNIKDENKEKIKKLVTEYFNDKIKKIDNLNSAKEGLFNNLKNYQDKDDLLQREINNWGGYKTDDSGVKNPFVVSDVKSEVSDVKSEVSDVEEVEEKTDDESDKIIKSKKLLLNQEIILSSLSNYDKQSKNEYSNPIHIFSDYSSENTHKNISITQKDINKNANHFSDTDLLFEMIIKSIVAKVMTVIDAYRLFHRPIDEKYNKKHTNSFTPLRSILGGAEPEKPVPKVMDDEDAMNLYVRLPLLAEWYRNMFGFEHADKFKESVPVDDFVLSVLPNMDGVWSDFNHFIYNKVYFVGDNSYNESQAKELISIINNIIKLYRSRVKDCNWRQIIDSYVLDINRSYGFVKKKEVETYLSDKYKLNEYAYDNTDDEDIESYDILNSREQFAPINAPSDKYTTQRLNLKQKTDKLSMYILKEKLLKFRNKIDKDFYGVDKINSTNITYTIQNYLQELSAMENDKDKYNLVLRMMQVSSKHLVHNSDKLIMLHETVVAPLSLLTSIYDVLISFSCKVNSLEPAINKDDLINKIQKNRKNKKKISDDVKGLLNNKNEEICKNNETILDLITILLQVSSLPNSLITVNPTKNNMNLDFNKIEEMCLALLNLTKLNLNKMRVLFTNKNILQPFESKDAVGSINWLEENLVEQLFKDSNGLGLNQLNNKITQYLNLIKNQKVDLTSLFYTENKILNKFNDSLKNYLTLNLDAGANKFYMPLIENFANGVASIEFLQDEKDTKNDYNFSDNNLLILNINKKLLVEYLNEYDPRTKKRTRAYESITEIPEYMKDRMRVNLPYFIKEMSILNNYSDNLKRIVKSECISLTDNNFTKTHGDKILTRFMDLTNELRKSAEQVLREISDINPLYMDLRQDFIQDYKNRNGKLPFMPLSSILITLKNPKSSDNSTLLKQTTIGTDEYKFNRGVRLLLGRDEIEPNMDHMPGVKEIYNTYSNTVKRNNILSMEEYASMCKLMVKLVRFTGPLINLCQYKLHIDSPLKVFANNKNLSDVINLTENSNLDANKNMITTIIDSETRNALDRDKLRINNIVDMDIVPINVHAMMREIPFVNLLNYSYTFDRMVHNIVAPSINKDTYDMINTDLVANDTKNMLLKLLIHPYANNNVAKFLDYCKNNNLRLGLPKYLKDQICDNILKENNNEQIFDTKIVRNLVWLVNLQRIMRVMLVQHLDFISTPVINNIQIANPKVTEYEGTEEYDNDEYNGKKYGPFGDYE
jgi:hypothetical protein